MKSSDIHIEKDLLNKMFLLIRIEEANNLKTGKLSDQQMVNRIVQIIQAVLKEGNNEI